MAGVLMQQSQGQGWAMAAVLQQSHLHVAPAVQVQMQPQALQSRDCDSHSCLTCCSACAQHSKGSCLTTSGAHTTLNRYKWSRQDSPKGTAQGPVGTCVELISRAITSDTPPPLGQVASYMCDWRWCGMPCASSCWRQTLPRRGPLPKVVGLQGLMPSQAGCLCAATASAKPKSAALAAQQYVQCAAPVHLDCTLVPMPHTGPAKPVVTTALGSACHSPSRLYASVSTGPLGQPLKVLWP